MMEQSDPQKGAETDSPLVKRRRRIWLTVLLSVIILVSGMAIGSGVTLLWLQRKVLHRFRHPERVPAEMTAQLRSTLDLTDEQAEKVGEIVRSHHEALRGLFSEVWPKAQAEREKMRAEIAAVLTPEQVKKWNDYFETMQRRWSPRGKWRPKGGPHGRGPHRRPPAE